MLTVLTRGQEPEMSSQFKKGQHRGAKAQAKSVRLQQHIECGKEVQGFLKSAGIVKRPEGSKEWRMICKEMGIFLATQTMAGNEQKAKRKAEAMRKTKAAEDVSCGIRNM